MIRLICQENDVARRLDRVLRKSCPAFPLSLINKLIREGKVTVNGKRAVGSYKTALNDNIIVNHIEPQMQVKRETKCLTLPLSINVVYEDSRLIAFYKPRALLTCGGKESLAGIVRPFILERISPSLSFVPGPLHRLDYNTEGIVVFSKSLEGARLFSNAMQKGVVNKYYRAFLDGIVPETEVYEDYFMRDTRTRLTLATNPNDESSRLCVTKVTPLKQLSNKTLTDIVITSGFTHQIRAQCAAHGHPLTGDFKYGGSPSPRGYYLQAYKVECAELDLVIKLSQQG